METGDAAWFLRAWVLPDGPQMAIQHLFLAATFPCIADCEYCAVTRAVRCSGSCAARVGRCGRGGEAIHIGGGVGCSAREEEEEGVLRLAQNQLSHGY